MNQQSLKTQQTAAPGGSQKETVLKTVKMLMVGPPQSGKTSILSSYVNKLFLDEYKPSFGLDFRIKTINYKHKQYKLQLWQLAGTFNEITNAHYKYKNCIYAVYDSANKNSFKQISKYLKYIEQHSHKPLYICLVGAKCDQMEQKKISTEMGMQLAEQNQIDFMEVSSILDHENNMLDELFQRGVQWFDKNK